MLVFGKAVFGLIAGIGATSVASSVIKSTVPQATSLAMKIVQGVGIFALAGFASEKAANWAVHLVDPHDEIEAEIINESQDQ